MDVTYWRRLSAIALAAFVLAVVASLAACSVDDDAMSGDNYMMDSGSSAIYDGKWDVGTEHGVQGTVRVVAGEFLLDGAAHAAVARQLFPGGTAGSVTSSNDVESLSFSVARTSDNSLLYSIKPFIWSFTLLSGGLPRTASVAFSPRVGTSDGMSWGTLSKAGVLTIVLHATSYTIGDGDTEPVDLKLTFTGKRKK